MEKKLAIVTGSSKGIGAGIVENFKKNNWLTLGISRSSSQICKPDIEILTDLFQTQIALSSLKAEIQKHNNISQICLVHNFGYTHNSSILSLDEKDWDLTLEANLKIPFLFTQEITPLMTAGSSHMFIGSTLSTIAVPDSAAYITSKHGLAGFMKATAIEFKDKGIRANLICPGFTKTDMADKVLEFSAQKSKLNLEEMKTQIASHSPLKRFLEPEEIGNFVVYVAEAPAINGEVLHINGGFNL